MGVFVQFACVLVQIPNRVLVDVLRFLTWSMNVRMRMSVGMGVLVCMRVHDPIGVRMLVRVGVRVNVGVRVVVLDLSCHGVFLLWTGEKSGLTGCATCDHCLTASTSRSPILGYQLDV